MSQGPHKTHIFDLPREIIEEILKRLARNDYDSIMQLSKTCRFLRDCCDKFTKQNPRSNYIRVMLPDSDESDGDYWDDEISGHDHEDDLDFDQLSFGSNYNEDLDEYINGPERDYDVGY